MLPTPTRFDATFGDMKGKEWIAQNGRSVTVIQNWKVDPDTGELRDAPIYLSELLEDYPDSGLGGSWELEPEEDE